MDALGVLASTIPVWLIWPVVVGVLVYWFSTRGHSYWKHVGIPYVPAIPFLGSVAEAFTNPVNVIEVERYRKKGLIYGTYEANRAVLTMADPDVLRDIFVKDFQYFTGRRIFSSGSESVANKMVSNLRGEDWKRVRTLITPSFTTGKIKRMTSIFLDSAKTLSANLEKAAKEGKTVDMKMLFGAFSMDVIASSAFGTKIDSHNDPQNPFVTNAKGVFSRNISWRFVMFILMPSIMRLFDIEIFAPHLIKFFTSATLKIVEDRKRSGQRRNDFLQLLIDAEKELELEKEEISKEKDEATEMGHEEINDQIFKPMRVTKSLSNSELVAQCVIFFLAGYDTTASTMSFTVYELARNPEIQERLIAEIDDALRNDGELRYESISGMKYLDCIVSETLRKYPPGIRVERVADEEYRIKKYNVTLLKGMIVGIPVYAMHHDPQYYPEPEKYDPDRFTPETKATRHPYTYLPFGAGPRNCVAMRFALMEVKVGVAYVLSRFRFRTCPQTKDPLEYYVGQGLLTPKEVTLNVQMRNDAVTV